MLILILIIVVVNVLLLLYMISATDDQMRGNGGAGTQKDLDKAQYWHKKALEAELARGANATMEGAANEDIAKRLRLIADSKGISLDDIINVQKALSANNNIAVNEYKIYGVDCALMIAFL